MQIEEKRIQAYESIMQNLLALKKQTVGTRLKEAAAIEAIVLNLTALRDGEQNSGVFLVSGMQKAQDANTRTSGLGKVAAHAK